MDIKCDCSVASHQPTDRARRVHFWPIDLAPRMPPSGRSSGRIPITNYQRPPRSSRSLSLLAHTYKCTSPCAVRLSRARLELAATNCRSQPFEEAPRAVVFIFRFASEPLIAVMFEAADAQTRPGLTRCVWRVARHARGAGPKHGYPKQKCPPSGSRLDSGQLATGLAGCARA